MGNGNIVGFIKVRPNYNRSRPVGEGKGFILQWC